MASTITYAKFCDLMSMIQVCPPHDFSEDHPYFKSVEKLVEIFNDTANKYHASNSGNFFQRKLFFFWDFYHEFFHMMNPVSVVFLTE